MNDTERKVLSENLRGIIHMRQQISTKRFGLVFGAGIGRPFGFPLWNQLIDRIAKNKHVKGNRLLAWMKGKTSSTQLLYQNFRTGILKGKKGEFEKFDRPAAYVQGLWYKIVHDALYKEVPEKIKNIESKDRYLSKFLPIIKTIPLTVTYNFDDTLEKLLSKNRSKEEVSEKRGFRTIWNADIQLYAETGVIYHPNGFLPRKFLERPSDDLVFLEDSFGDQLIDSASGHYSILTSYFSQNTCLLIGLSLDDPTLKHLLRKCANIHPGHVQYYVHMLEKGESLTVVEKAAMRDSNFEVYNMVTLFLEESEIGTLGELLHLGEDDFEIYVNDLGQPQSYKYFLTGSVGVGKSTAVTHFRSLQTHDEWLELKLEGMSKDPSRLRDKEIEKAIDHWVANQWHKKNYGLVKNAKKGIHIIDRAPLDAFTFTRESEWRKKAKLTRDVVTPPGSKYGICKGEVILMIGDPEVMGVRALKLRKDVKKKDLNYRQGLLRVVYNNQLTGVVVVDTCSKSAAKVAKELARIIHMNDYQEFDFGKRLNEILAGKVSPKKGKK